MSRPLEIISGDTYEWNVSSSLYQASDGWVLKVTYSNAVGFKQVTADTAADGVSFDVTLSSVNSAALAVGVYTVVEAVQKGANETLERHTITTYQVTVSANVSGASVALDARTHARKMLELIQTSMLASAGREYVSISIDGRATEMRPWSEMRKEEAYWQSRVNDEEAKQRAAMGLATGRNTLIRFV